MNLANMTANSDQTPEVLFDAEASARCDECDDEIPMGAPCQILFWGGNRTGELQPEFEALPQAILCPHCAAQYEEN